MRAFILSLIALARSLQSQRRPAVRADVVQRCLFREAQRPAVDVGRGRPPRFSASKHAPLEARGLTPIAWRFR